MLDLSGTGVALVTPFKNNQIDFESLTGIIHHVIEGGVEYIVSLGTTGEAITLSPEECIDVLHFTREVVKDRVPIIAGHFGGNYTEKLYERIANYDLTGISAIMSSSPAYSKPAQEGIFLHYMRIAEASPLPIIIYNVPGRTASNISADTIVRLAHANEKFIAVKEASGDLTQSMQILKNKPDNFKLISGDDALTLPLISCGASGVISVIANAYPHTFSQMVRSALNGDFATARDLNNELLDVHPWLYVEGNPAGIKTAMAIKGFCASDMRIPLVPLSAPSRKSLEQAMEGVRFNH